MIIFIKGNKSYPTYIAISLCYLEGIMKQDIYSAIPMDRFGINTVVLTRHKELIDIREVFMNDPDWAWCEGKGKRFMHQMLKKDLVAEDAYFEANIDEAIDTNLWMTA
jgi:hypothetical protein